MSASTSRSTTDGAVDVNVGEVVPLEVDFVEVGVVELVSATVVGVSTEVAGTTDDTAGVGPSGTGVDAVGAALLEVHEVCRSTTITSHHRS
jgi:hypothetical protein